MARASCSVRSVRPSSPTSLNARARTVGSLSSTSRRKSRVRVDPMHGAGGDAEIALERAAAVEPGPHEAPEPPRLRPGDGANEAAQALGMLLREVDAGCHPIGIAGLDQRDRGGEQLARLAPLLELAPGDLAAGLAGHAQSVDMRLDPLVEPRQVVPLVVRGVDGLVAQQPEERRLLGVLLDDVRRGSRGSWRLS